MCSRSTLKAKFVFGGRAYLILRSMKTELEVNYQKINEDINLQMTVTTYLEISITTEKD